MALPDKAHRRSQSLAGHQRGERLCIDSEKEKALSLFRLRAYLLVRLAGIEPTTPWFVAKYSIQLSYSR